jgi:hypothetical protein
MDRNKHPAVAANFNDSITAGWEPIIAPLWDDLQTSRTVNVNYVLSGTAPNRVLTIEWLNMCWQWHMLPRQPSISFQVKLYKTTNVIDFTYQRGAFANDINPSWSPGAVIGLCSGSPATNFYCLDNSGTAPTARYGTLIDTITTRPLTNQVCCSPGMINRGIAVMPVHLLLPTILRIIITAPIISTLTR